MENSNTLLYDTEFQFLVYFMDIASVIWVVDLMSVSNNDISNMFNRDDERVKINKFHLARSQIIEKC